MNNGMCEVLQQKHLLIGVPDEWFILHTDKDTRIVGVAPHCHSEVFYERREEKEMFASKNYPGDGEGISRQKTQLGIPGAC